MCCVVVCGSFSAWWIILEKGTLMLWTHHLTKGKFFLWMQREMSSFLLGFLGMESLNKGWSLHTKACQMPQSLDYFLPSQDFTEVMEFTEYVRKTRTCLHRRSFCFLRHHLHVFSQMKNGENVWGRNRACPLVACPRQRTWAWLSLESMQPLKFRYAL